MLSLGHVVLELVQNVSLIALVAIGYASLRRSNFLPKPVVDIAMGLLFGCGAVLALALRIEIMPGVFVDGRNIMNSLVVVFCGPVAATISVLVTVFYRLWVGGAGALSGTAAAIAAALVAFGFSALRRRHQFRLNAGSFLALGVAVVLSGDADLCGAQSRAFGRVRRGADRSAAPGGTARHDAARPGAAERG